MKCLIVLTLVAFSCAYPYYGASKSINIGEDGTIEITGANGKRVVISKAVGNEDDKFIDISVEGPNMPPKKIRINELGTDKTVNVQNGPYSGQFNGQYWDDEWREKRSPKVATTKDSKDTKDTKEAKDSKKTKSQADLLYSIFKKYEGAVDELSYQSVLKKVDDYVEAGELDSSIHDVLQYLHDQKLQEQTTTETSVQPTDATKVPVFHTDISSMIKDYIWTNKYQPALSANVADQSVPSTPPQGTPLQQQWIPQQQQLVPQQQQFVPQQQKFVPQQQQFVPQQQQFVPQQQQWIPQQQWVPQQQQWVPQQQQFVPQQQKTTQQVSQQGPTYNPWIAYYLSQYWNQQRQNLAQQTPSAVNAGHVVGYPSQNPWQFQPVNQGFVY